MSAKQILLKPISATIANDFVRKNHYSGKVVPNSQIHLGVFYFGKLEGVMQFGPSLAKKNSIGLVADTAWNGFIELNRMAFSDTLPKNSESRAIGIALRMIKKHAPTVEWVISFADGTQCGDGTIYRASGFVLTDIKVNQGLKMNPETGEVMHQISAYHKNMNKEFLSWMPVPGYQLRYVYFINKDARKRLTVPELPFTKIAEMGATMYKGSRPGSIVSDASDFQSEESGAIPTPRLQPKEA
jgi:hypothetical protein